MSEYSKALKQFRKNIKEWGELMSDYIKREEATSVPVVPKEHRKHFNSLDDAFETGWNEALACVNMIPSADVVEVRHGRWEHDGSEWKYRFLCSECGYKLMDVPTNYCPNCGAKMDKKEQEHE